jgi:hypothetical protein
LVLNRILMQTFATATLAGIVTLAAGFAMAQEPSAAAKPGAASKTMVAKKWTTPWGDPDLQGVWSNATTTPLERPAKYAGREFLTPEDRTAQNKETAIGRDKRAEPGTPQDVAGAYNAFWWEWGKSDGRTSLIYDPPDGRIPARTPEGERRRNQRNESVRTDGPYYGPEDLDLYTRCIIRSPLPRLSSGYDNNFQIVQTPEVVAILQEMIHEVRIIRLDGRPHLYPSVRQWLGDSRGHWEGDTLVVETTNFNDRTRFQGSSKDMRLVERWTRVADDRIDYRFTVTDPATWTRPWSAAMTWYPGGTPYEYACNEGNVGLYGILAGARADEQKATVRAQGPGK